MYAVIDYKGKQYKVEEGKNIKVAKTEGNPGDMVTIDQVTMLKRDDVDVAVGTPYIEGAKVEAKILKNGKDKKVVVFKYRPKKGYRVKNGHRQDYTLISIEKIEEAKK